MKFKVETVIKAPRQRVFGQAIDVANWDKIVTAIEKIEILTPGPIGVGTRFRETRKMFGQEASEEMTFAEFEPGSRFLLTAHSHGTRYRTEHMFSDYRDGTRLMITFEGKPVSHAARLMSPFGWLMCWSLQNMLAGDLDDLKSAVERAT